MDRARIEDVMRMAVKADPPLRGALRLTTKFVLPPGESDVADRLRLDGEFAVARVRFMNYDVQGKINELSRRGRGRADQPRIASSPICRGVSVSATAGCRCRR
jgi:hypothetical protein